MTIEEITGADELESLLAVEDRGVVLDFWGTWCQPCRSLRPHLEQLASEHGEQWRVVAVHAEESADLVERYGVQATPTIVYLHAGEEVHRSTGAVTPSRVAQDLADHAI